MHYKLLVCGAPVAGHLGLSDDVGRLGSAVLGQAGKYLGVGV